MLYLGLAFGIILLPIAAVYSASQKGKKNPNRYPTAGQEVVHEVLQSMFNRVDVEMGICGNLPTRAALIQAYNAFICSVCKKYHLGYNVNTQFVFFPRKTAPKPYKANVDYDLFYEKVKEGFETYNREVAPIKQKNHVKNNWGLFGLTFSPLIVPIIHYIFNRQLIVFAFFVPLAFFGLIAIAVNCSKHSFEGRGGLEWYE